MYKDQFFFLAGGSPYEFTLQNIMKYQTIMFFKRYLSEEQNTLAKLEVAAFFRKQNVCLNMDAAISLRIMF